MFLLCPLMWEIWTLRYFGPTGLKADKAFFDSLSGEDTDEARSEAT